MSNENRKVQKTRQENTESLNEEVTTERNC